MYSCSKCRAPFLVTDEIDLAGVQLPGAILGLAPLVRPHLSRLLLFRCPSHECGGLITAIYRPRTLAPVKRGGDPVADRPVSA